VVVEIPNALLEPGQQLVQRHERASDLAGRADFLHRKGDPFHDRLRPRLPERRPLRDFVFAQSHNRAIHERCYKSRIRMSARRERQLQKRPSGTLRNHIDYRDDTGFTADRTFVDRDTLHHGGMISRRR